MRSVRIVLTNKCGETMRQTLNKARELGLDLKADKAETPKPATALSLTELAEYAGTYKGTTTWDVYLKEGKLFVKNEGPEYLLPAKGDRKFSFGKDNENELVFLPGKSGKIEFVFSETLFVEARKTGFL